MPEDVREGSRSETIFPVDLEVAVSLSWAVCTRLSSSRSLAFDHREESLIAVQGKLLTLAGGVRAASVFTGLNLLRTGERCSGRCIDCICGLCKVHVLTARDNNALHGRQHVIVL